MLSKTYTRARGAAPALLLILLGCAEHRAPAATSVLLAPVREPATRADLVAQLADFAARWATLKGEASLDVREGSGHTRSLNLRLALAKPEALYLQGYRNLLPTFFTLVGNSDGVWLDVPSRATTYHARPGARFAGTPGGEALLSLTPADLGAALVPDPPAAADTLLLLNGPRDQQLLVLEAGGGRVTRRFVFDRQSRQLIDFYVYDGDGLETTHARYGDALDDGHGFPRTVTIVRSPTRVSLAFAFKRLSSGPLASSTFAFVPPAQRKLVDVAAGIGPTPSLVWPDEATGAAQSHPSPVHAN